MANPLLGSLVDPFTDAVLNPTLWNKLTGGPALDTVNDLVTLPVPTASGGLNVFGTNNLYDATGQAVSARVGVALTGNGTVSTVMRIRLDSSNAVTMRLASGAFRMTMQIAGVLTTVPLPAYDPSAHAWWRLRESGGTFCAETAADGFSWTTLGSAAYSWSPAAVTLQFETAAGATEAAGNQAWFAHVNTAYGNSPYMPSWPQIRFQIAFNQGANTAGQPSFVDLSGRLRQQWTAQLSGRQYEMDSIQSGQATATLWNVDGALDPLNTASPYWPNVLPLRPCRFQAVWPQSRNLMPGPYSNGTAAASDWKPFMGVPSPATGLPAAPTGHTTALAWAIPITASGANGRPVLTGSAFSGADETAFPVAGGAQYTVSQWLSRSAGGDTTLTVLADLLYYDQTGVQVGSRSASAPVSVLGTWTQITVTGTAPATATSARMSYWLTNTSTTAANTVYITAIQLEQAAAASPWTPGGTVQPLWAGFVERWPQQWDKSGTYGLVDITCVDSLAALASFTLQPSLQAGLAPLNPVRLLPLDEPTGSTKFRDSTGRHSAVGIVNSAFGSGTVTAGSSITGSGFVGAAGPVVTVANPAPSNVSQAGSFIQLGKGGPTIAAGWTRIICFRTTTVPPASVPMAIWYWSANTIAGSQGGIYIDHSHQVNVTTQNAAGQSMTVFAPSIDVCDGNWHMAAIILTADGKLLNINVDGQGFFVTSASNCNPAGIVDDTLGMAVTTAQKGYFWAYSGDIAYAVDVPTNNVPSFPDLASGFATGWAGETSAARAQRLLTMAGYLGKLGTLDATTLMGGANVAGADAMSALQLVGDTEAGQLYTDAANTLWLASRKWRYLQTAPTITFGENQDGGEVPYLGDAEIELDDTHIYNDATVINQPLPGAPEQPGAHFVDTASQAQYLPKSLQRTINVQDTTVPLSAAQYIVGQYAQPLARVGQLTVDAASNPALWPLVLPLAFGTPAQVIRRPPPPAAPITVSQFIESLTWAGDDEGNLKVSLQMSPAGPYLGWWVMASLHTTVATASTAGTAVVTLGALTGSAANPAAAVLSPGTTLTLGYGTATAETLTVKTVATTAAGYTSVAVTFTANTAHNHAVGELVCQPLPGGVTLPTAVQAGYPQSLDAAATLTATTPRVAY